MCPRSPSVGFWPLLTRRAICHTTSNKGNPITSNYVKKALEERLGEDVRITILGHVQRGGAPSAFDRYMSTVLGHAAAESILEEEQGSARGYSGDARGYSGEAQLVGIRQNDVIHSPLMESVTKTHEVAEH